MGISGNMACKWACSFWNYRLREIQTSETRLTVHSADCCFEKPVNQVPDPFTQDEKEGYLERFWLGVISKRELDLQYHERHSQIMLNPVIDHLGDPDASTDELRAQVAREFRTHVFEFSAAKQYTQARQLSEALTPEISFPEFRAIAEDIFDEFNKTYLETEFDTAVASSQNANQFIDAVETVEDFPLVQYKTQNDGRVRPAHRELHNITLPPTHPFWRRFWPPNGWNCRCFVVKLTGGKQTNLSDINLAEVRESTPDLFRQNPAMTGQMFDKSKHPYFEVERGDSEFRDNNFGLPIP